MPVKKKKYYAYFVPTLGTRSASGAKAMAGPKRGVTDSWAVCEKFVSGKAGARFKAFDDRATAAAWLAQGGDQYLLNVAWLRPGKGTGNAGRISATSYTARNGTKNAPCTEGGECLGFIEHGHWVRYEQVDFGSRTEQIEIRAASASGGGIIEIRLDQPDGELLGTCPVPNTGDWQDWASFQARIRPVSGTKTLCLVFKRPASAPLNAPLWFAQVDASNTTIWAQFPRVNPNEQLVEINVRRTVFYPDQPGRNYITVRGFTMCHAATPWAPPTAEQIGLIGTHWSKGWIIENNEISHSVCSGIALGKHGDQYDNTSANSAEGYVKTIERAHANAIAWTRENIGHHLVRNNTISHCEQAGVSAASAPPSAPSPAIRSTTSTSAASSPGRRWPASSSTPPLIRSSPTTTSTGPAWGSGWTGWRRAPGCPATSSMTTPATICLSRWTTGRSWWTTTSSSRPRRCS